MPKREQSPDAPDDARYFTVYTPYPLNPNWAEEEEQRACAVWIAECIGPTHLWAIHSKPSSRGMILLEISRDFEDHASLLGEHRWSEFLKDPTDQEKGRVTQVFHSFYARGREAQKDVQSEWFEDWAPGTDRIKHPYPNTHWCSTPVEDQTNKILCRPLPADTKPPPPRAQSIVVGSSTWAAKQTESTPSTAELASAWSGGGAQIVQVTEQAPTTSNSSSPTIQPRSPISPGTSTPASPGRKGKKSRDVRVNSKPGWAAVQPTASPGAGAPFAEDASKGPVNAWTKPLNVPESQSSKPTPAPAPQSGSLWVSNETDYAAWKSGEAFEDNANGDAGTPDPPNTSTLVAPASSPRKGRTQVKNERRAQPAASHKDHSSDNHNGSSRRESTSKAGSDRDRHDAVDIMTPQNDKRREWDVPSPEKSSKHTPKPRDKKTKKKKETTETLKSGSPVPKTPDVKASKGSPGALRSSKLPKVKVDEDDQDLSPLKTPVVKLPVVKLEYEAASASQSESPKEATDAKMRGKAKENIQVDFSSEPEDRGIGPVPEQPPANTSKTTKAISDYDNSDWGAVQGGSLEDWGLPADPFLGKTDNLNEAEFHTWEENTSAVNSAKDPPKASASELTEKYLKSLKCPTHKRHCNKNICKDMALLMREEEAKLTAGAKGKGRLRDRNTGDLRKTEGRHAGPKRGPGPSPEVQKTGNLMGAPDNGTDGDAKQKTRILAPYEVVDGRLADSSAHGSRGTGSGGRPKYAKRRMAAVRTSAAQLAARVR
ncbi:hypothetical protein HYPSUDRAFT_57626 [Hypholoma sublateritium FD-334 SS-4]|uniref:Uncharacterized protein n=1 Tax=Hypholoma sublateritium (strain FD-334 SS-4) TaxID=945553 RepID=A0A0D2M347_HYPSF|nr:hypothetical protein HYPSUDRAFT_57626 [Hypholoma sublateritium FD-334 SS-4]